ncbi:MAG: iron-containing alcohol dehydrogenase [Tepidibacillus sp.]
MYNFVSPLTIISGAGSLAKLPEQINRFNAKKVMIFADPGVIQVGIVKKVEDVLVGTGITYDLYSEIIPEPPVHIADQAVSALKNSDADMVIGIGGGSSLDITKAVAVLSKHEGTVADYLNLTGTKKLSNKGLPKILIPTTSGTGSEVTDIAVFSLESSKDVITNNYLLADVAIVDPELTYTLPPRITAATGVDALTHAVEALISVNASPLTDALALDAIRRISQNIRTGVWHGSNVKARNELSWGSLIAGLSFYNAGVSGVHALAYPLGGLFKLSHGDSNAVLLPYVFDFVWPSCIEKMVLMADALGVNRAGLSNREAAIAAVKALYDIVKDVGIPTNLQEFDIKEEYIEKLSQDALKQKRLLARSPKPFTIDDIRKVYTAAYNGKLNLL